MTNLPHLLSTLVGRDQERVEVSRLLTHQRLVTLTGPGGCGKTRLALQVAADVADHFPDSVYLVELAPLNDPALVPQAVGTALALADQPGQSPAERLIRYLQSRRLLILLDNCEHMLTACATLTATLLRTCPHLHILATGREALHVPGEVVWPVPPLSFPGRDDGGLTVAELGRYDAVRLFVERAATFAPAFHLTNENAGTVARLCRLLDGLPLALELAAARTRMLSLHEMLDRLDHSFHLLSAGRHRVEPRQQTMQATIDWSYNLLPPKEMVLFRRLSVFAGGFTLAAAEAVCAGRGLNTAEILDLLAALLDKSLLVIAAREVDTRYRLLEVVRQYAGEKLQHAEEADHLRHRHAAYYLQLAQEAAPHLKSAQREQWLDRLESEYDNLRAALAWLNAPPGAAEAQTLMAALSWFWYFSGRLHEGRQHLARALRDSSPAGRLEDRAAVLWGSGAYNWVLADYAAARRYLTQCEALWRQAPSASPLANKQGLAYALTLRALILNLVDDHEQAAPLHQASRTLFNEIGDTWGLALASYWHAEGLRLQQDYTGAGALYQESLTSARRTGDPWSIALPLQGLGAIAYRLGDYTHARAWLEECLSLRQRTRDRWLTAQTISTLAAVQQMQNDSALAHQSFAAARLLYQDLGDTDGLLFALRGLGQTALQQGQETAAAGFFRECLALSEDAGRPARAAECRAALAALPPGPISKAAVVSPALQIFALGAADVYRGDHLLTTADWRIFRSKELFFYLLHSGPQTREQIGLAFWPDATPAQLRHSLHDTLYRLRRALGDKAWIVYENGHYAFNHALPHWYDVTAFTDYLSRARQDSPRAIEHLRAAVQLYQDDFLASTPAGDWSLLLRQELRQSYLDALLQIGQLLLAEGDLDEAAGTYRHIIAQDNLLEKAHQGLMRCYARQGNRNRALRHYHTLSQLVEAELGATPTATTTALYQRLRRGEEI